MLKDILQKFDKEIFTDELVEEIQAVYDKEVNKKIDERVVELNKKYDIVIEEMESKVDDISEQYKSEIEARNDELIEAIGSYLDDLKEEVFEDNKMDYENIAIVKDAIEVHKANLKIQKLYNIETSDEKIQENEELEQYKSDVNKYYRKLKDSEALAKKHEKDLVIFTLGHDLKEEAQDELLAISKSLKDDDIREFTNALTESRNILLEKNDSEKPNKTLNEEVKNNNNIPYWKR